MEGVLGLDVPKCCMGQPGDPGQHPNRYWLVPVPGPVPCKPGVCWCQRTQQGQTPSSNHLPGAVTKQAPNYMKLTQPTNRYLFSLATFRKSFQPGGEEFDAKHWSQKPQRPRSSERQWRRAVDPSSLLCPWLTCPCFGLHSVGDSAREREPQERLEINVFGGGNWSKKSVFCRGVEWYVGLLGGNPT